MGKYQIPQDVEVADKILGPLTLKQFIFAIMFFASGYVDFLLFQAFPLLVVAGLPFTAFFGVLAFYQRSDQPVEVYLMSALRFYTTSRKKIWDASGYDEHVEITAPKVVDIQRTKDLTEGEILSNLNSLSKIMDTRGWASRNMATLEAMGISSDDRLVAISDIQTLPGSVPEETTLEDQRHDILDGNATTVARKFNNLVEQRTMQIRQQALAQVQSAQAAPAEAVPAAPSLNVSPTSYEPTPQVAQLATNNDLTVSAIAREADSAQSGGELIIR